jgi:DNA-binding NtrC family response regulator
MTAISVTRWGASEFITKPIDRARLVELVQRFTGRQTKEVVLIVDDDPEVREIARATLHGIGLATAEAMNGRAALAWIDNNAAPALILLDLMMPEMDASRSWSGCASAASFSKFPSLS